MRDLGDGTVPIATI